MKIKQISNESIILTIPVEKRYFGLFLIILGILIPIYLFIINNYQIIFNNGLNLKSLILNLSLGSLLAYIFVLEIPIIFYFFSIQNNISGFGHILLLVLNITSYIGMYSSIFSFSFILISGIYFLTHFKSVTVNKNKNSFNFQERIILFFYTRNTIPFSEIREISLEYKIGLRFLNIGKNKHRYYIKLHIFEKDPGFEDNSINIEEEEESAEFFRPQTLRKTLLSKSSLIDSSFLNIKNKDMRRIDKLIKEILRITDFSRVEESKKDKKVMIKFRK